MATPHDGNPAPTVPGDPLDMALNALASMRGWIEYDVAGDTDPEKRLKSHVYNVAGRADQDSKVAARMALVSIAGDVRRYVDHVIGRADAEADRIARLDAAQPGFPHI